LEGSTLEDLFQGRGIDIPAILQRLKSVAEELGLPFGDRQMTYNSRRAQELGKWAETQNGGEAFHQAVFHAYFAEGRNIAEFPVLMELAEGSGLDPEKARQIVEDSRYRKSVDLDWQRSRELGITAVPSFLYNGRILTGAHPYKELERFVLAGGARKRAAKS
jgi:predicted DsbA family dithiol-disulfide isomerase